MAKKKSTPDITAEDILRDHKPEVRANAERLRSLVRETVPEAVESAHALWHSIHFNHPRVGYFCGLFPQEDSVNLLFEYGVLLPDPTGILVGDAKQVRYVPIAEESDIQEDAMRKLLLAAVALPGSKAEKLAMIQSGARMMDDGA